MAFEWPSELEEVCALCGKPESSHPARSTDLLLELLTNPNRCPSYVQAIPSAFHPMPPPLTTDQVALAAARERNDELLEAISLMVNERYHELVMMACEYSDGTPECAAWHHGVFAMWRQLKLIKAPGLAILMELAK